MKKKTTAHPTSGDTVTPVVGSPELFDALTSMRGDLWACEFYDGCERDGWDIPQEWAEAAGMPRFSLCEEHRALFHEAFLG
jgi:hypothetical protein